MPEDPTPAELRQLIEERRIERLLFDYAYYLDQNQPDKLAALFVDDCEVSYAPNFGASGKAAYRETLDGVGSYFAATSHHVSNIAIDFPDASTAHVRSVLVALHRYRKDRPDGWMFGQYHDVVVKTGAAWRFKRRELRTTMGIDYHVKTSHPIGRAG